MGSASERALELVRTIDALLEPWVGADHPERQGPAEAKRRRTSAADQRYLVRLLRATRQIQKAFEADLRRAFLELGARAARGYRAVKQEPGDALLVEQIIGETDLEDFTEKELRAPFRRLYTLTGEVTYAAVSERMGVDVGWSLADPIAREVVQLGGRRAGLVDLDHSTRTALFQALHAGRSAGEGPAELARRIRDYVPAGRFVALEEARAGRGVAYRSELIARTETTFARNVSAIAAGEEAHFDRYLVFDARIGPTDEECEALDGEVVDQDEAERLILEEHPNGTRSVSPVPRT